MEYNEKEEKVEPIEKLHSACVRASFGTFILRPEILTTALHGASGISIWNSGCIIDASYSASRFLGLAASKSSSSLA